MRWRRRGAAWQPAPAASSCTRAATASRFRTRSSRSSSRWPASAGCRCSFTPAAGSRTSATRSCDLATEHPGARLILAHAGISDLGLLAPHVGRLPNILFDTSWWHVSDLLTLFATVPPGQILYASDMPYGGPRYPALLMLRCARAVGLTPEQAAVIAGGQLERVLAGEDLLDLGPAAGAGSLGARVLSFERVISYVATAVQMTFLQGDPTQAFALARLACQAPDGAQHRVVLQEMDRLIAVSQQRMAEGVHPLGLHLPGAGRDGPRGDR